MDLLLLLLLGDERSLLLGESSSDGTGLLGSEVERGVPESVRPCLLSIYFIYTLLVLVEKSELRPLVGVYDGKNASDAFPDIMDAGELGRSTSGDLASPQADQLSSKSVSIPFLQCFLHISVRRTT